MRTPSRMATATPFSTFMAYCVTSLLPRTLLPIGRRGIVSRSKNKCQREGIMCRWIRALALHPLLAPTLPAGAAAQDYPTRPIRAIASQGAGGFSDLFMRALGQEL